MTNVLLIGKPNSGKSLLFQKLTGLYQKVANFPGVTVEIRRGKRDGITWIDFPGTYSLNPITRDEEIATGELVKELQREDKKILVCVLDAFQLERSLVPALQAIDAAMKAKCPVVLAVNMMDEVKRSGLSVDLKGLEQELGLPVIGVSAKTEEGLLELQEKVMSTGSVPLKILHPAPLEWARELSRKFGPQGEVLVRKQNLLDRIFLSNFFGGLIFLAVMILLFQSIFTWASPLMDFTEASISWFGELVANGLPDGAIKDFIKDALFGGLGSFVVFVPQVIILTFVIGLLEDSGYLARATIIGHLPFKFFGLSGKSFVPYLSGHACAIPAIMAARTIESPRTRLLTMITIPFTSCSARLPVYALLISAFIPATPILGPFVTLQGLTFFALYFLGIITALLVSAVLSKALKNKVEDGPFIIELPRYRWPSFRPLAQRALRSGWTFIRKAGPIIFAVNLVIWFLGYFPRGELGLAGSYLASIGKAIGPIFAPLGVDWRYGVAILLSFLAREVFVGTLGTLFGIEGADENIGHLADQIRADGLALSSGIGLLVFYALAMQCVSTLAVLRAETGSRKIPAFVFIGYTVLAYAAAVFVHQMVALFGY